MSDLKCPYCKHEFDIEPSDYEQDAYTKEECPECAKIFLATATWNLSFSEEKADCLNGSPHTPRTERKWNDRITQLEVKCRVCGEVLQQRKLMAMGQFEMKEQSE